MADYTIPMQGQQQQIMQQHLTAVDPNIPMSVKPFEGVDPVANQQKALTLASGQADFQDEQRKRADQAKDRATLQALQDSGINFHTSEGLGEALKDKSFSGLSQTAQDGLLKRKQAIDTNAVAFQEHISKMDILKRKEGTVVLRPVHANAGIAADYRRRLEKLVEQMHQAAQGELMEAMAKWSAIM